MQGVDRSGHWLATFCVFLLLCHEHISITMHRHVSVQAGVQSTTSSISSFGSQFILTAGETTPQEYLALMQERFHMYWKMMIKHIIHMQQKQLNQEETKFPEDWEICMSDLMMFHYENATELQTKIKKFVWLWVGPALVVHVLDKTHYLLSNWLSMMLPVVFHMDCRKSYYLWMDESTITTLVELQEILEKEAAKPQVATDDNKSAPAPLEQPEKNTWKREVSGDYAITEIVQNVILSHPQWLMNIAEDSTSTVRQSHTSPEVVWCEIYPMILHFHSDTASDWIWTIQMQPQACLNLIEIHCESSCFAVLPKVHHHAEGTSHSRLTIQVWHTTAWIDETFQQGCLIQPQLRESSLKEVVPALKHQQEVFHIQVNKILAGVHLVDPSQPSMPVVLTAVISLVLLILLISVAGILVWKLGPKCAAYWAVRQVLNTKSATSCYSSFQHVAITAASLTN